MSNWRADFAEADPRYGPVPLWWWSGEPITTERIRWQMGKLRQAGLRNLCVINLAPSGPCYGSGADDPPFFSEPWWELFGCAVREAERLGMFLWFYDQIGFSGANFPSRLVAENPAFAGHRLVRQPAGTALAEGATLLHRTDGQVIASVRQGFDWLDPAASAALLDRIHGEMERRFSDDLGRVIVGSFQDELQPMSTWSPRLPEAYRQRYGEDLLPRLPLLVDGGKDAGPLRRRFYGLLGELAEEAFFRPLGDWHKRFGMLLGCDQAGPGRKVDPHGAQRLYLDYFRTHRHFSAPGSDMDGEAKPHASLAHINGLPRVWLEGFHSSGWGGTVEETLHWLVPWLQAGVTLFDPHAIYYATRGGWWEWAPPDTGWRQPYAEHYPIFADLVARICWLLTQGRHVCDIAVYYPGQAVWEHMSPGDGRPEEHPQSIANRDPDEAVSRIRQTYWSLVGQQDRHHASPGALRAARWDFDVLDDGALAGGHITAGALEVGEERYRVLLLPGVLPPDPEARRRLEQWADQGGLIIGVSMPEGADLPARAAVVDAPDAAVAALSDHLRREADGPGLCLHRRGEMGDVFLLLPDTGLLPMHRAAGAPPALPVETPWRLCAAGTPELWDPVTGTSRPLAHTREGEWLTLSVPFRDWPAALVVCAQEPAAPGRAPRTPRGLQPHPAAIPVRSVETSRQLPPDSFRVTVVPTADNRYGDFDRHDPVPEHAAERRHFRVRTEAGPGDGLAAGWHLPETGDSHWPERLWSEAPYWLCGSGERFDPAQARPVLYSTVLGDLSFRDWAGRMGRVPRAFLNLGRVAPGQTVWAFTRVQAPADGTYWLSLEGVGVASVAINGQPVTAGGGAYAQRVPVALHAGWNEVLLRCTGGGGDLRLGVQISEREPEPLPEWIGAPTGGDTLRCTLASIGGGNRVRAVFAARGHVELWVNDQRAAVLGDFNPYVRSGEQTLDLDRFWRSGDNAIALRFPEGSGQGLLDGEIVGDAGERAGFCTGTHWAAADGQPAVPVALGSTEALWIRPRPHPLPGVGWLMPDSVPDPRPLPLLWDPGAARQPVWLRFPLPIGARAVTLAARGKVRVFVQGAEVPCRDGQATFPPQSPGALCALRVEPDASAPEAAVLQGPVRIAVGTHPGMLGDWRTVLHLPHHSGAVEYEAEVEGTAESATVDLGYVRGTAQVWVDGQDAGVRLWHPYVFDLQGLWGLGRHRLRIRVTNTLGTHYAVGRPTSLVGEGQAAGGLFGPVRLGEGG